MELSKTQLSNFATFAGLVVLVANHFGFVLSTDNVTFILGAGFSVLSVVYNYYQRWVKGDVSLLGVKYRQF